jgi:hypothetical protein
MSRGVGSSLTLRWRELDSNFQFRAETGFGFRLPTMTSVPRSLALGGDAGHDAGPDDVSRRAASTARRVPRRPAGSWN